MFISKNFSLGKPGDILHILNNICYIIFVGSAVFDIEYSTTYTKSIILKEIEKFIGCIFTSASIFVPYFWPHLIGWWLNHFGGDGLERIILLGIFETIVWLHIRHDDKKLQQLECPCKRYRKL